MHFNPSGHPVSLFGGHDFANLLFSHVIKFVGCNNASSGRWNTSQMDVIDETITMTTTLLSSVNLKQQQTMKC